MTAATHAAHPLDARPRDGRRCRVIAAAVMAAGVLLSGGCGGDRATAPRQAPPRSSSRQVPAPPATREAPEDLPVTRPDTRPATRLVPLEPEPATQPSEQEPATQPATQATSEPATQPATQPATAPATAPSEERAEREPRLLLVEEPTSDRAALAEVFGARAIELARAGANDLAVLAQATALAEAAVRMAPENERLARQLVDLNMRTGDLPGALEALEHYRRLRSDDVLAQIRYVDITAAQMESADEKLEYLIRVAQTEQVPPEVRSHAAAMASLLLREALDEQGADVLLEQAVSLDPYSPQALQMDYERLVEIGAARARRVQSLAMLARSNILQPAVLSALAEEVAGTGLPEQGIELYQHAGEVYAAMGVTVPAELVRDMASLQLITNRPQAAQQMLEALGQRPLPAPPEGEPGVPQIGVMLPVAQVDALLLQPMTADGAEARATLAQRNANLIRAQALLPISRALGGEAPPPPPDVPAAVPKTPLPDVVADAQRLSAPELTSQQAAWRDRYAIALSNLAWLDLYFLAQPTDERILEALALLAPPDSLTLARLRGWQLWRQEQVEPAREALTSIAERDGLAQLGLVLMDAQAGTEVTQPAQDLLARQPSGLVGAFLADALRPFDARIVPAEDAPDVREALATLPPALFELLDPQNVRNFYSFTSEPLAVGHEYGQPILLSIAVRNNSRHPITIGPEGLIRPTVRLDALVRGLPEPVAVPAANAVELWGAVRLDPGEKLEQTVRLDGPQMQGILASAPQVSLTIIGEGVTTNPAVVQTEQGTQHVTGPAGQTQRARRVMTRSGFPLDMSDPQLAAALGRRMEQLRTGEPLQRLRTAQWAQGQVEWLNAYADETRQAGASEQEVAPARQLAAQIAATLQRSAASLGLTGPDAAANAWVRFSALATMPAGENRDVGVRELLASPSFEARLVGLLAAAAHLQDAELRQQLLEPLAANDPDPAARQLAEQILLQPDQPPATQPAAAQPAGGAGQ